MNLTAWEHIEIMRTKGRPTLRDYIPLIFDHFIELHGDRAFGDDEAILGGVGRFQQTPVTVIGHIKGRNLKENKSTNFAMAHPEGYRKALRLMKQAEKFHRPIITFVDTPGAFCGVEAEEGGIHHAIALNQMEMMSLKTPIITIVLGEGGSGGAIALAVCDHLFMLEHATYSVISPRGFSSLLWKDPSREKEAANLIGITAADLVSFGLCDGVIPEPYGGAQENPELAAKSISQSIGSVLLNFVQQPIDILLENRYSKFRKMGVFNEAAISPKGNL